MTGSDFVRHQAKDATSSSSTRFNSNTATHGLSSGLLLQALVYHCGRREELLISSSPDQLNAGRCAVHIFRTICMTISLLHVDMH